MKKIWIVIAMLFVFGCSQATEMPVPAPLQSAQAFDVIPVLYGKDADTDLKDEYFIAAMEHSTGVYSRVQIGTDDFLRGQWVAQRKAIVYMSDGQWGIVAIEDISNDLELWAAPQNGWDISGVWALFDTINMPDISVIDSVSYQNGIHVTNSVGNSFSIFPDGAGSWIPYGSSGSSITLDNQLTGWMIGYSENFFIAHDYDIAVSAGTYGTAEASGDQIITDEHGCIWLFDLDAVNNDLDVAIFDDIMSIMLEDDPILNAITEEIVNLAGLFTLVDYNAVTNFADNTIHVVTIEKEESGLDQIYSLKYYRRDQNGWNTGVTVDSWTFDLTNADQNRAYTAQQLGTFPQISIYPNRNIVIYYLEAIPGDPAYRDLRRMYLGWADYFLYATPAEWTQVTNIDSGTDDIRFCLTIGNHPEL